jgi:stage II sporulation protein P
LNFRIIFLRARSRMHQPPSGILVLILLLLLFLLLFELYRENLTETQPVPAESGLRVEMPVEISDYWLKQALCHGLPLLLDRGSSPGSPNLKVFSQTWEPYLQVVRNPPSAVSLELGWLATLERTGRELLMPANTGVYAAPYDETLPAVSTDWPDDPAELEEDDLLEGQDGTPSWEPTDPSDWFNKGSGTPLIAIYNTHNAETYIPSAGKAKVEGNNGGVAEVAKTLAVRLEEKHGIATVYVDTIHDYPDWTKSYVNSKQTVKALLAKYPDLKILVDVHRDSLPHNDSLSVKINGQSTARIMFVVGSEERRPHPQWKQNQALAQQIADYLDAKYPGVCRGVRVKPGTYNQELHAGAILVEMGNDNNSLQEAERAAVILAEALSAVVKD